MAKPSVVTEARKRSDELIAQVQEKQRKAQEETEAGVSQHLAEIEAEDEQETGQAQTEPQGDGEQEEAREPGQANTPPASGEESGKKPGERPDNDTDYRKRYEELKTEHERLVHANTVLRGKYESEVPRMAAELRELRQQLSELKEQPAPAGNTPEEEGAANTEAVEKIKQSLLEEYPQETVDNLTHLIEAVAKRFAPTGNVSEQQIEQLQGQVETAMGQLREQKLTNLVPDWKEIEANKASNGWVEFLQHRDPVSGRERQDFLAEAWANHDVERAAQIFNLFKQQLASREKDKPSAPPAEPEPRGAEPAHKPADDGGKVKYSDIQYVEKEARKGSSGAFAGKPKQLQKLRERFRKAAAQGLVDYNR